MSHSARPRDLRAYARSTTARLIVGGLLLVVVVGGGLVYAFYGAGPLFGALACIGLGLLPMALVMLFLWILELVRERADRG